MPIHHTCTGLEDPDLKKSSSNYMLCIDSVRWQVNTLSPLDMFMFLLLFSHTFLKVDLNQSFTCFTPEADLCAWFFSATVDDGDKTKNASVCVIFIFANVSFQFLSIVLKFQVVSVWLPYHHQYCLSVCVSVEV